MSKGTPSKLPLVAMIIVYMLCALAAYRYLQIGLMIGSEIDREREVPFVQWAAIAGPLVVTIAMLSATIVFWNKGRTRVSYALFAIMIIAVLAVLTLFRAPAV